ncbi:hypothetical protein TIFTF001_043450 [Ficus carica]|uniref:Uncharacterized protein n=1 Tax=Ficus carica TaxID=3494 RepID=A0AA87YSY0_FICCA|nr:hypothetical protein TIFTF001_043450 [Ficus carica]
MEGGFAIRRINSLLIRCRGLVNRVIGGLDRAPALNTIARRFLSDASSLVPVPLLFAPFHAPPLNVEELMPILCPRHHCHLDRRSRECRCALLRVSYLLTCPCWEFANRFKVEG